MTASDTANQMQQHSVVSQTTGSTPKLATGLTESYLPAVMQALAYYIELIQYEPLYTTTVEPPFTVSTTPLTLPISPTVSTTSKPPVQHMPVTWWSPPTTVTKKPPKTTTATSKPVTQWNPPSDPLTTAATQTPIWYEFLFLSFFAFALLCIFQILCQTKNGIFNWFSGQVHRC